MVTIQIDLPDEVLLALKETPEGLSQMIRMAAAAKLYELGKLSSGRAAELAGNTSCQFPSAAGTLWRFDFRSGGGRTYSGFA